MSRFSFRCRSARPHLESLENRLALSANLPPTPLDHAQDPTIPAIVRTLPLVPVLYRSLLDQPAALSSSVAPEQAHPSEAHFVQQETADRASFLLQQLQGAVQKQETIAFRTPSGGGHVQEKTPITLWDSALTQVEATVPTDQQEPDRSSSEKEAEHAQSKDQPQPPSEEQN